MQGRQWFRSHSHTCAGKSLTRECLCSFGWCAGRSRVLLEPPHLGHGLCASSSAPLPTWIHPPNSKGEPEICKILSHPQSENFSDDKQSVGSCSNKLHKGSDQIYTCTQKLNIIQNNSIFKGS